MNTKYKHPEGCRAFMAAAFFAIATSSVVAQTTETFTDSIVNAQMHFGGLSGLPVSLPKFNHSGAILLKAELSITTFSGTAEFKFENLNGVAVDVLRNEAYTVTATPVASEPGPFVLGAKTTYSTSLAKFDGNPDFGGSSGFTANIPLVVTTALPSITVTDSTVLANQYTGAGTLDWVVKDSSTISGILPNPNNVGYTAFSSLVIQVVYTYAEPVSGNCVAVSAVAGFPIVPQQLVATGGTGAPYTFSASGLPAGLTLSTSGLLSGTPTVSGVNIPYTVTITDKDGHTGTLNCSVTVKPPTSADCVVIDAVQGVALTPVKMGANGGCGAPFTFSATGLPASVSMATDGTISGTPTVSGIFDYTVTVTDSCGNSGNLQCSLTVNTPPSANCATIVAVQGVALTPVQLVGSGGTGGYTFTATGLPSGVVISTSGVISGTPTVSGTFNYTVTITDKDGHKGTLNCSVNVQPPSSADCVVIEAVQGVAITPVTVGASGGCGAPFTFTQVGLPTGLTMTTSGTISGTPTVSGTFDYTVTVTDSCGNKGSLQCSVTVGGDCTPTVVPLCYYKDITSIWPALPNTAQNGDKTITVGCQEYTEAQGRALLALKASCSGRFIGLAKQLLVVKLNILNTCNKHECIDTEIERAESILCLYSGEKCLTDALKIEIKELTQKLEDYNTGLLCGIAKAGFKCPTEQECDDDNDGENDDHGKCYRDKHGHECHKDNQGRDCWYDKDGNECYRDKDGNDCYKDSYGRECHKDKKGNLCYYKDGRYCHKDSAGRDCWYDDDGNECHKDSYGRIHHKDKNGNECYLKDGKYCHKDSQGRDCTYDKDGRDCWKDSTGRICHKDDFGRTCWYDKDGNECRKDSEGNTCWRDKRGHECKQDKDGHICWKDRDGREHHEDREGCEDDGKDDDHDTYHVDGKECHKDSLGRDCWFDKDGNECHKDNDGNTCYKDKYGRECHKDKNGNECYLKNGRYCHKDRAGRDCWYDKDGNECFKDYYGREYHKDRNGNDCYLKNGDYCHKDSKGRDCTYDDLGRNCWKDKFGRKCHEDSLGRECWYDKEGNECRKDSNGDTCWKDKQGRECHTDKDGNTCWKDKDGTEHKEDRDACEEEQDEHHHDSDNCYHNSEGKKCHRDSAGRECWYNAEGKECHKDSRGNECWFDSEGKECHKDSKGNTCWYNSYGTECHKDYRGNTCWYDNYGRECHKNSYGQTCAYDSYGREYRIW